MAANKQMTDVYFKKRMTTVDVDFFMSFCFRKVRII